MPSGVYIRTEEYKNNMSKVMKEKTWMKNNKGIKSWHNISGLSKLGEPSWNKGKKMPSIAKENSYRWKYNGLHRRIIKYYGKVKKCFLCGINKKGHWANISGMYKTSIDDFAPLCVSCHKLYDLGKLNIDLYNMWGKVREAKHANNG